MLLRRMIALLAAGVLSTAGSVGATASEEPTTVDDVSASVSGSFVSVTGSATFVDVVRTIATDPAGDAVPAMVGADLISATVERPSHTSTNMRFRLGIADAIPGVFGVPEVVHYSYFFGVGETGEDSQFLLQSLRTANTQQAGANPFFRLLRFRANGTCCDPVQTLTGSMGGSTIEWNVPMTAMGLSPGDIITAHPVATRSIQVQLGASGQQWLNNAQPDFMPITTSYVVPGATVEIGIAPAGTPPTAVPLTGTAGVSGSNFTGSLPAPAGPGDYVVVARACYGPGNCGIGTAELTIA